ncbi:hypothetical protein [Lysobacter auxotrophicus]|uniref:Uncharacterized protein n=1 Tax=Lysobacter auxotrophicus TaxID=2992573 RepID=A0ABN6UJX9_9GAMM|nr:hypothetical protein [Lysobacter auxotrophicus]BDU16585.1 hypothetical protein LA521A_17860 [Lysobacter auxotrophicus]
MEHVRLKFAFVFVVLLLSFGIDSAVAAERFTSAQTATAVVTGGSRDGLQVNQWLRQLDAPSAPGVAAYFAAGDRITITRTSVSESSGAMSAPSINKPAVPLPTGGSPGETITIEHTGGGWLQSWTYQWSDTSAGEAWGLMSYRVEKVKAGPASN